MTFQILATVTLALALFTVALRTFSFATLKLALIFVLALAIFFVWRPDDLTTLAGLVGIDRGADLISYLSTLVLLLFVISVSINARQVDRRLTAISRQIAISNAEQPDLKPSETLKAARTSELEHAQGEATATRSI